MSQVPFDLYGNAYQKGDLPRKYSICHPRHGNLWFSVRSLLCMESAIANIVICAFGIWNRPEEDLQKDFPELARANKPSGRAPRQQVFMTGVWAPITMASAQESRDRALIRTTWMATATLFRTLPKVTKSTCSDSVEAPTPCAY